MKRHNSICAVAYVALHENSVADEKNISDTSVPISLSEMLYFYIDEHKKTFAGLFITNFTVCNRLVNYSPDIYFSSMDNPFIVRKSDKHEVRMYYIVPDFVISDDNG